MRAAFVTGQRDGRPPLTLLPADTNKAPPNKHIIRFQQLECLKQSSSQGSKTRQSSLFAQGREQRSRVNGYRLLGADGGGCSLIAPDDLARGSGLLHDDPPCHLPKNNAGPPRSAASICENGRSDGSAIALKSAPREEYEKQAGCAITCKMLPLLRAVSLSLWSCQTQLRQ